MRISALRPHVTLQHTKSPIHETSLHPQVLRQKHTSTFAHEQLTFQTTKVICIHLLRSQFFRLFGFRLVMIRTQRHNRLPRATGQLVQLELVYPDCAFLSRESVLPPIHQQRRWVLLCVKLAQLLPSFFSLLQSAPVTPRQPSPVRRRPSAIRHPPQHSQKLVCLLPILFTLVLWHVVVPIVKPMHLPQFNHVLKGVTHHHAHVNQLLGGPRVARRAVATTRLVLSLSAILALRVQRLIPNRRTLLGIPRQHCVTST